MANQHLPSFSLKEEQRTTLKTFLYSWLFLSGVQFIWLCSDCFFFLFSPWRAYFSKCFRWNLLQMEMWNKTHGFHPAGLSGYSFYNRLPSIVSVKTLYLTINTRACFNGKKAGAAIIVMLPLRVRSLKRRRARQRGKLLPPLHGCTLPNHVWLKFDTGYLWRNNDNGKKSL